jgi:hypothetical protein
MKMRIDVENKKEGELIKAGLLDPTTRALVKVMGALGELSDDRARRRVLAYVTDRLAEQEAKPDERGHLVQG